MMNSKERFNQALLHKSPDRPPIDYLALPETDRKLKEFYGVATEIELLNILGVDFYYLSCRDISQNETCLPFYKGPALYMDESQRECPFGIRFRRKACQSKFAVDEAIAVPLENASCENDILRHPWPKASWFDFEPLYEQCIANDNRVIVGGLWSGILGDSYRMHGFQNFLCNMAFNPQLIKTLVDRVTDFYLEANDRMFATLKNKMDIWFFGNDFGFQESLLCSIDMFCEFFIGNIKRLCDLAHSYGLKVMMHSCGSIASIIPLLIDAGVDMLDPVQVTASGMDITTLKQSFGNDIVFHGAIDTQQILPFGSPEQVRNHVIETRRVLGAAGGYITAPSQVLQPDIPVENIDAMYTAAKLLI